MDTTIKVTTIHIIFGILSAFVSLAITIGWLGFKNDVLAAILPFIILYLVGQLCQRIFGDEVSGFSQWLWDGIAPFYFTWLIAFIILFNYSALL
ncbi:MAG: DUF5379 family protein [Methanobrevibacter sp.]|nr:DUF5379 family protein [Methanobrevibacter sp.]